MELFRTRFVLSRKDHEHVSQQHAMAELTIWTYRGAFHKASAGVFAWIISNRAPVGVTAESDGPFNYFGFSDALEFQRRQVHSVAHAGGVK